MHNHNTWSGNRDHPRRCGENRLRLAFATDIYGSPPQVRGKLLLPVKVLLLLRITPAGAGKTNRFYMGFESSGDHPRRCGENEERADISTG